MIGLLCAFRVMVVIGQSICKQLTGKLLELAQDSWEVCCGGKREGFVKTAHTSGYLPCKACAAHSCTATPFTRPYAIAHSSENQTPSNLFSLHLYFYTFKWMYRVILGGYNNKIFWKTPPLSYHYINLWKNLKIVF